MLHLKIQKVKEAIKTSEFQKYLGGTNACIKILAISHKGCGQLASNVTYFADIRFSSVKTAEETIAPGVDYCGLAKTIRKDFCLATVKNLMRDFPGGSYLVM